MRSLEHTCFLIKRIRAYARSDGPRRFLAVAVDDLRSCEAAASRAGHRKHAAGGVAARFREGGRAGRLRLRSSPERRDAGPPPALLHLLLCFNQVAAAMPERAEQAAQRGLHTLSGGGAGIGAHPQHAKLSCRPEVRAGQREPARYQPERQAEQAECERE